MITIKIERDKTRTNFSRAAAGPQLPVRRQSNKRRREHSWTHIEQVAHQGALPLNNCCAATELYTTKNDAGPPFLSRFSGLVISYRETKLFFASAEMIQRQLGGEFILVPSAGPSRVRETRRVENRRLSSPLSSQSQRLQSGRSSALSRARAPRCEAIASSDNKSTKTDVRPPPTRGGCQPQDQYH